MSQRICKPPKDMGTVGEPSDLVFNLDDISIDTLLFRIKVVDKNNTVKGFKMKLDLIFQEELEQVREEMDQIIFCQ